HEHGIENQPRRRQWAPNTDTGKFSGPDIFVVIRTSEDMDENVEFSGGIVSWGQATPTQPDAHIFPPPPTGAVDEPNKFREFPWGSRALGFVTMFQEPPDRSGFNWIRTHPYHQQQTGVLQAVEGSDPGEVGEVLIDAVSPTQLRQVISDEGQELSIFGSGFGETPEVTLDGLDLSIRTANDEEITARIPGGTEFDSEPLVLTVFNPDTRSQDSRQDLFTLTEVDPDDPDALTPKITNVSPSRGGVGDFPITVFGENFDEPLVFLETNEGATPVKTRLRTTDATSTRIDVDMPVGGLPRTGMLDMRVVNQPTGEQVTAAQAFEYISEADAPWRACFVATAAYGSPLEKHLDSFRAFRDGVLLKSAAGTALVETYYSASPPVAEFVAAQPLAAAVVRAVLTPLAWVLSYPGMTLLMLGLTLTVGGACFFWKRRQPQSACEGVR
ncbi:MAG: CFI-box-CTERM domain-containing protein, partial [Candidatus Hydrogenedentota bacterium]